MVLKKWWEQIKKYGKRHTFHMIVIVTLTIFGILHFSQFVVVGSIYEIVSLNKTNIENNIKQNKRDREEFYDITEKQGRKFSEQLVNSKMELNSRLDILDSAIKPEKKRRMMIVKIRNAITENTKTKLTIRELNNISIATLDYSYQYNLSIVRILAQMKVESNFEIKALSVANAKGLMQIIPETWEYIILKEMNGKKMNIHNIYHNIKSGCFYMSEQIMKFDSYDEALMAYNWGPHRVRKLKAGLIDKKKIPLETIDYVKKNNKWTLVFETYGLEKY